MLSTLITAATAALTFAKPTGKAVSKYQNAIRSSSASSMTQYNKSTRCEPITMIDHNLATLPEMPDLMATLTSIFAAMYSQSFSIAINKEIGGIKVLDTLDQINPDRSKLQSVLALSAGFESAALTLPDYSNNSDSVEKAFISLEGLSKKSRNVHGALLHGTRGDDEPARDVNDDVITDNDGNPVLNKDMSANQPDAISGGADIDGISKFMSNLSTGILFEVTVNGDNNRSISIPITLRLLANKMPSNMLISLFDAAVRNRTAKERFREWRSGGLTLWNDIILCKDILRNRRDNLIKDGTGMYNETLRRRSNNKVAGIISGNPSISQISNIVIVSTETVEAFERESGKKLKSSRVRKSIFDNTQTLILAVVNRSRETVTLHYHDISVPTTVTFRELRGSSGGGEPDMMEIIKAFQMGNGINL